MIKHYFTKILIYSRYIFGNLRFINNYFFHRETNRRKKISVFNYEDLATTMPGYHKEFRKSNVLYGINFSVKNALHYNPNKPLRLLIEHGYYFGNYVPVNSFNLHVPIVTYSRNRMEHIKVAFTKVKTGTKCLEIITIGPYINYAQSILDARERKRIKEDYRKILLVFPSHSIEGVTYKYNKEDFINEIEKVSKDFDSVFVCMYWKDIQEKRYVEYEDRGYKIVTAGHINDPNFLGRLKDIIDLSDMTMSNTVGTHIGYCVARNKPHYLFNQHQKVEGNRVNEEFKDRKSQAYLYSRDKEVNEVIDAFSKKSYKITEKQRRVVETYWGKNEVTYHVINGREPHND